MNNDAICLGTQDSLHLQVTKGLLANSGNKGKQPLNPLAGEGSTVVEGSHTGLCSGGTMLPVFLALHYGQDSMMTFYQAQV